MLKAAIEKIQEMSKPMIQNVEGVFLPSLRNPSTRSVPPWTDPAR